MPQDSLFGTSARTTGFTVMLHEDVTLKGSWGTLSMTPLWSKRPSGRDGSVGLAIGNGMLWSVPELIHAGYETWQNSDPKHVPSAVRSAYRLAQQSFGLAERAV